MFNFTKKHSRTPAETNEQAAEVHEKYNAAIIEIERLESELTQKTHELNQSCKTQYIMSQGVKNCVASLYTVQSQLQTAAAHLDRSNKHISELMQKNRVLKSSGDEWFRRAIKLEFNVLTAHDMLKKIEHERDVAVKMCERLQVELVSTDKKNRLDRHRD